MLKSCPTLCNPIDYIVHGILHGLSHRILEWSDFLFSRGFSPLRDWTQVSHIAGRFFTSWATREAYPLGSLSLPQGIFLTQKSNWGLLHCRWILHQLSYERNQICQNDHVNIPAGELIWTMIFTILLYSRLLSGNLPHDLSYLMDPRKSHWFPVHSPFIS